MRRGIWLLWLVGALLMLGGCGSEPTLFMPGATPGEESLADSVLPPAAPVTASQESAAPLTPSVAPASTERPEDGVVYRNYALGVSLTFPASWEGYYRIQEHAHGFDVEFWGSSAVGKSIEVLFSPDESIQNIPWQPGDPLSFTGVRDQRLRGIYLFSILDYLSQGAEGAQFLGEAYGTPIYLVPPGDLTIGVLRDSEDPAAEADWGIALSMQRDISSITESFAVLEPEAHVFRHDRLGFALDIPAEWTGHYRVRESYSGCSFDYWGASEWVQYRESPGAPAIGLDVFYIIADFPEAPFDRSVVDSIQEIGRAEGNPFYYCTGTDSYLADMPKETQEQRRLHAMHQQARQAAESFQPLTGP